MPTPAKGARLLLRRRKGRDPTYVIKDTGERERSTGTGDLRVAQAALATYIRERNRRTTVAEPEEVTVAEVLSIYGELHAPHAVNPERIGYAIDALLPFWGKKTVSTINGPMCRAYMAERARAPGTMRRELGTLQAALNFCDTEGYLTHAPSVTLPEKPETKQRALSRSEVARLLMAARRTGYKHIARFILISIYTGTRPEAVINLAMRGPCDHNGWFDLDAGILYRIGTEERVTRKKRTPAKMPRQLLAHTRRWRTDWAIEWRGTRVGSIKNAWKAVVTEAKKEWVEDDKNCLKWDPTQKTLKHTAITWAIQNGSRIEDASSFFATSVATIENVYWHVSPHFQIGALTAIEKGRK